MARDWTVTLLNIRQIYDVLDNTIAEYDGIFEGRHKDVPNPVLFLLKVKRIFTAEKYATFRKKVAAMIEEILPALRHNSLGGRKRYVKMARILGAKEYEVRAVVASPSFEGSVLKEATASNTTVVIKLAADQFTSVW